MTARLGDAVRVGDYQPGTPAWEQARAARVGGSEVAALVGLSPWESWFSLFHRKRGVLDPIDDTSHMWWGREIEPVIAARFAEQHPEWEVRRTGTWVNRDRDYQLISPDRILYRPGGGAWELLELKHPHNAHGDVHDPDTGELTPLWGESGSDEIPVYYRCQALWAMDCFGITRHRFAVYFGGGDYREYLVHYDADEAAVLRKRAVEFLDAVRDGIEPVIDEHTATYRAVVAMHPDIDAVDVDIPERVAAEYLRSLDLVDDAKALHSRCRAEVADLVGDGRRALYGTTSKGTPRAIATRVPGRDGGRPYLRANPRPKTKKEIA